MATTIALPKTINQAVALLARAEFDPKDDIAELGDLMILRDGDRYTFVEEPNDYEEDPREVVVTIKLEK